MLTRLTYRTVNTCSKMNFVNKNITNVTKYSNFTKNQNLNKSFNKIIYNKKPLKINARNFTKTNQAFNAQPNALSKITKPFGNIGVRTLSKEQKLYSTLVGTGALVGLGSMMYIGNKSNEVGVGNHANTLSGQAKKRIRSTMINLIGGLGLTAASAVYFFRSGIVFKFNPMLLMGISFIGCIGSLFFTRSIDYNNNKVGKYAALGLTNALFGLSMAPLGMVGGPLLVRAAMLTGTTAMGLGLISSTAPSDAFLWMGGPLSIGFGVVFGASLARIFLPQVALLHNIAIFGGMAVFGGMLLYKFQVLRNRAEFLPYYDPVNECLGIYVTTINLFQTIVQYLILGGNKRR
eukprot:TRINITY_DN32465_c0_g1_i1.p1 TRINITY_DN32465_c0_g1~~TRINITY_DN32465_c0_g1_i1.p1  ORF type:complete len:347 (-),score=56.36 TRINITY_DN32465_c0_g1_i1:4-1044(-)